MKTTAKPKPRFYRITFTDGTSETVRAHSHTTAGGWLELHRNGRQVAAFRLHLVTSYRIH